MQIFCECLSDKDQILPFVATWHYFSIHLRILGKFSANSFFLLFCCCWIVSVLFRNWILFYMNTLYLLGLLNYSWRERCIVLCLFKTYVFIICTCRREQKQSKRMFPPLDLGNKMINSRSKCTFFVEFVFVFSSCCSSFLWAVACELPDISIWFFFYGHLSLYLLCMCDTT